MQICINELCFKTDHNLRRELANDDVVLRFFEGFFVCLLYFYNFQGHFEFLMNYIPIYWAKIYNLLEILNIT